MKYDIREISPDACTETVANPKLERTLDYHRAIVILRKKTYNQTVGSYLGNVWLVLDPLVLTLVYLFVFSIIAHREEPAIIFVGLGIIRGLQRSLLSSSSPHSLKSQSGFPIERIRTRVTVAASVMVLATDSFFMGIGISGVLVFLGTDVINALIFIPILFISNFWWHSLGTCLLGLTSKIPDLHKLLSYFGMGMFFASPVLYSFDMTSGIHRQLCLYNPAAYFIELARFASQTKHDVDLLPLSGFAIVLISGITMFVVGSYRADKIRWMVSNRS